MASEARTSEQMPVVAAQAGQGIDVVEGNIIEALISILRASKGTATVPETVMALYKADSRYKDMVKNQMGTTVIDILARHPEHLRDERIRAVDQNDDRV